MKKIFKCDSCGGHLVFNPDTQNLVCEHCKTVAIINKSNNDFRPILVRALTENTLYEKSYLFKDHRVVISYDYMIISCN